MRPRQYSLSPGKFTVPVLLVCALAACTAGTQTAPAPTSAPTDWPMEENTAAPASAAMDDWEPSQPLRLVWQSEFSPDGAISSPSDMVVDGQGNVYVSSQSKKNIKKFDWEGKFLADWGSYGTGEGQFNLASGIALDRQGNVYVVDFNNARIQKFDSSGEFLLQWPTRLTPASIGIDWQGNVYVDIFLPNEQHVQKFDDSGKLLAEWGSPGAGDGQIGAGASVGPEDVALDKDGNVYIADRVNHRIQKFDPDGIFLAKFGGQASEDGHGLFSEPKGIAVDTQGNMYVLDSYFLQKLDPEGSFIAQWSTTEGGDLDRAAIVALDGQDNIYVFARTDVVNPLGDTFNVFVLKKFSQQ